MEQRSVTGQLQGVEKADEAHIIGALTNLGRDMVEPLLALDHATVEFKGVPLMLVYIPE